MSKKTKTKKNSGLASSSDKLIFISEKIECNPENENHLEIISLRHPHHGRSSQFIYNSKENGICEIIKFTQPFRSWFIGNSVCSDGSLYLSTTIDPLFLILPYLSKAKMSSPLDQLIHDDEFPDSMKLETLIDTQQLDFIADKKDYSGLVVWKYNEDKSLKWLSQKTSRLAKALEEKGLNVDSSCAVSKTFVRTTKDEPEQYMRYSHGMISEYLDPYLAHKLASYLKIPILDSSGDKKRKNVGLDAEEIKRIKTECKEKAEAELNEDKKEKTARKNPKRAALAKAASGSKNISSFFSKK